MDRDRSETSGERVRRIGNEVADVAEVVGRAGARSAEVGGRFASEVLTSSAAWMRAMTSNAADAAGALIDQRTRRRRRRDDHLRDS